MNWQDVLTAMLPEHLLLVGMLLILGREIATRRERGGFAIALLFVAAAACAAAWLGANGYASTPFPGHYSVAAGSSLAKAVLLALALPVLLISRDDFEDARYYVLVLASLYGACLITSSDQLRDAVPRPRDHVAAGVRAGPDRLPAPGKQRGSPQVPRAQRRGDRDPAHGCIAALRLERVAGSFAVRQRARIPGPARRRGRRTHHRGAVPQGGGRAAARLGAGRLRGRQRARHGLHGHGHQGGRAHRRAPPVRHRPGLGTHGGAARGTAAASRWPGATSPPSGRRASGE